MQQEQLFLPPIVLPSCHLLPFYWHIDDSATNQFCSFNSRAKRSRKLSVPVAMLWCFCGSRGDLEPSSDPPSLRAQGCDARLAFETFFPSHPSSSFISPCVPCLFTDQVFCLGPLEAQLRVVDSICTHQLFLLDDGENQVFRLDLQ